MNKIIISILLLLFCCSCHYKTDLDAALEMADDNGAELRKVLDYYKGDSLKLKAAVFLIENMPGHYSYEGNEILKYYAEADRILMSDLQADAKKDSIVKLAIKYPNLSSKTIPDIEIITADYLIKNIEHAFDCWAKPWAAHFSLKDNSMSALSLANVEALASENENESGVRSFNITDLGISSECINDKHELNYINNA